MVPQRSRRRVAGARIVLLDLGRETPPQARRQVVDQIAALRQDGIVPACARLLGCCVLELEQMLHDGADA